MKQCAFLSVTRTFLPISREQQMFCGSVEIIFLCWRSSRPIVDQANLPPRVAGAVNLFAGQANIVFLYHWSREPFCWLGELIFLSRWSNGHFTVDLFMHHVSLCSCAARAPHLFAGQAKLSSYTVGAAALFHFVSYANLSSCIIGVAALFVGQVTFNSYIDGATNLFAGQANLSYCVTGVADLFAG
ncbi:hypothetical protein Cgig2_009336 [Carnegiea gigantea]|uniref:Uncharacterized protein n=1 Tax=Carnegiea gigantea TaxID=171969 RepID=A0A9Q1GKX7_9CARY|nr:hypothetical protein Cgig2_009336 [Carnegiea gigantea]